eukprot:scaffold8164_cov258-Pinguiococcus_pyrenoidosus.AAC.3
MAILPQYNAIPHGVLYQPRTGTGAPVPPPAFLHKRRHQLGHVLLPDQTRGLPVLPIYLHETRGTGSGVRAVRSPSLLLLASRGRQIWQRRVVSCECRKLVHRQRKESAHWLQSLRRAALAARWPQRDTEREYVDAAERIRPLCAMEDHGDDEGERHVWTALLAQQRAVQHGLHHDGLEPQQPLARRRNSLSRDTARQRRSAPLRQKSQPKSPKRRSAAASASSLLVPQNSCHFATAAGRASEARPRSSAFPQRQRRLGEARSRVFDAFLVRGFWGPCDALRSEGRAARARARVWREGPPTNLAWCGVHEIQTAGTPFLGLGPRFRGTLG